MAMRGFSLVEMLLTIAIMAIIAGLTAPVYFSYTTNNEFGLATDTGVRSLRRAQFLAQNMERDSNWGAYFATSSITVYSGGSYITRNSGYDEVYDFPTTVTSTIVDINFTKFYGEAIAASTTLRSDVIRNNQGDAITISVNSKGMVDY